MGPHAHRTNTRCPVACSGGADGDLQRTTSRVLKGTHLSVQLRHLFCRNPQKTVVGQVVPTNQVPQVVLPTRVPKESASNPQKGWVLEALDLQGLREWSKPEQEQVIELLLKWEYLFAHSNLDLG